jgi:protein AbiQ
VGAKKGAGSAGPLFFKEYCVNLAFFSVDPAYCDYLREKDPCVPYTSDKKSTRPFVGIVFTVGSCNYYAPLTSPKPKHLRMKNQIDFLKINGGHWGAINFNNMIPIHEISLTKVDPRILPTDESDVIAYKNLLANQLSWCNRYREQIIRQASKLHSVITEGGARPELIKRCNFALDEERCRGWNVREAS